MGWPPTTPPKGHPMEPGRFPGELVAPGSGQDPSRDTPFVIACKRAAAHLGAWPWTPDGWDDSYSNRFAYGDPASIDTHAGMAALQLWAGTLDDTIGVVDERTFNWLRSVLIPQGRTHAGEPAWDSVCVQLTAQAYDQAYPPEPSKSVRALALEKASGQIGTKEQPAESNLTKYGDWYGENGVPWCAIFATWCYRMAGGSPSRWRTVREAGGNDAYDYVPYIVADARGGRNGLSVTTSPMPGDLVTYDWNRNGEHDHVGLFSQWTGGDTFEAVEGNTSTSDNSNGGQVMRRARSVGGQGTVFIRAAE